MSAVGQPTPGGPKGAASKKKRQQQLALAAGAAAVILIFLFARRGQAASDTTTPQPVGTSDLAGSGAGSAGGGDSGALPGIQGDPGPVGDPGPAGDPGPPGPAGLDAQPAPATPSSAVGQPAGAGSGTKPAVASNVHTASTGKHAGEQYKTVVAHGTVFHEYMEGGKKVNVAVRPASKPSTSAPRAPSSTSSHPSGANGPVGQPAATTKVAAHGATPGQSYKVVPANGGSWHVYSDHKVFVHS
jgi:hypothetical protein